MHATARIVALRLSISLGFAVAALVAACSGTSGTRLGGSDSGSASGGSSGSSAGGSSGSSSGSGSGNSSGSSSGGSGGSSSGSGSGGSSGSSSGSTSGGSSGSGSGGNTYDAVTINFDELPDDTKVTTQYAPHATFSCGNGASSTNNFNVAFDPFNLGQSPPNFICSDDQECNSDYIVVFGAAVNGLAFDAIGVDNLGTVATLVIHQGSVQTSVPVVGQGNTKVPVHIDLSPYPGVSEVDVTKIVDPGGFGLDTFVFQYPN
jgi:hypothetical protein